MNKMTKINYCTLLVSCILFLSSTVPAKTNVTILPDGSISVELNITLYGPGAQDYIASDWEDWINEGWNKAMSSYSCYNMFLSANVEASSDQGASPSWSDDTEDNADIVWGNKNLFPGTDSIYVTPRGQYFRSFVTGGAGHGQGYAQDVAGGWYGGSKPSVIVHEAGHLIGIGDHYSDTEDKDGNVSSIPHAGWLGNIMAETSVSSTEASSYDERLMEEVMNSMENGKGWDFRPCLVLEEYIGGTNDNNSVHVDTYKANIRYNVSPEVPVLAADMPSEGNSELLTGSGTGSATWTPVSRNETTDFVKYEVTNNPFPLEVMGSIAEDAYNIVLTPLDKTIAVESQFGQYAQGSTVQWLRNKAAGYCTVSHKDLSMLTLKIAEVSNAQFKNTFDGGTQAKIDTGGTVCDFQILDGSFKGWLQLSVKSKQG